jgi:hypothetical protein
MLGYRLYFKDDAGRIVSALEIMLENDAEALG